MEQTWPCLMYTKIIPSTFCSFFLLTVFSEDENKVKKVAVNSPPPTKKGR